MQSFLKKYSFVPNNFISDFFNITNEHYKDDNFVIKFDIVVKWLKVRKENLKKLLVKNFEEDCDYTSSKIKVKNRNRGSNYVDLIF